MDQHGRMDLAKKAAISVLNTLGENSYVNVIMFNHEIETSCFEDGLVRATPKNIAKLIEWIKTVNAGSGTDFELGFTEAFKMLNNHHGKHGINCHASILFLTDGDATDPSHIIREENKDPNAVIFSYTLGDEASEKIPRFSFCDFLHTHHTFQKII